MKSDEQAAAKALYKQLRALSWTQLWTVEVPQFDGSDPKERAARVAVIRAVGVVFAESGPEDLADAVRAWLRDLLKDPDEKIRRYAIAALPKVGAGLREETEMLALLQTTNSEREKKFLSESLEKIGTDQTLSAIQGQLLQTEQKTRAAVTRRDDPGRIEWSRSLAQWDGLRIHLRGRSGLETFVRDEVKSSRAFRVLDVLEGLVKVTPDQAFSLGDLYSLRCFGTVGFVLGDGTMEELPRVITSPLARGIFSTFTNGPIRYRLDFVGKGHQRGAVRTLANRTYAACQEILNDPRAALWSVDIHPLADKYLVEARPRTSPDPRFAYRRQYIPAASHPPLAACMAALAGNLDDEIVWDPFCGSGVELIECALRSRVRKLVGTDLSPEALGGSKENFAASEARSAEAEFILSDFREHQKIPELQPESVGLVISNPPLGMRVPIPDVRGLINDLFAAAAIVLRPGGQLIFTNPLRIERSPQTCLVRQSSQLVDMSGFSCRVERYVKVAGRK